MKIRAFVLGDFHLAMGPDAIALNIGPEQSRLAGEGTAFNRSAESFLPTSFLRKQESSFTGFPGGGLDSR
ncbi:MAG: hypothetical protein LBU43_05480 [Candidatus Accumulibacter sp.]|jgi:hypothetical protein|nr:hypothetical protein [Accumulibacter sp.]